MTFLLAGKYTVPEYRFNRRSRVRPADVWSLQDAGTRPHPKGVWAQIAAAFQISFLVKEAAEAAPQGDTSPTR